MVYTGNPDGLSLKYEVFGDIKRKSIQKTGSYTALYALKFFRIFYVIDV